MTNVLTSALVRVKRLVGNGSMLCPYRDWFVLLAFVSLVFIGLAVWSGATFNAVVNGGTVWTPVRTPVAQTSTSTIDVQAIFDARAAARAAYASGTTPFADPSL